MGSRKARTDYYVSEIKEFLTDLRENKDPLLAEVIGYYRIKKAYYDAAANIPDSFYWKGGLRSIDKRRFQRKANSAAQKIEELEQIRDEIAYRSIPEKMKEIPKLPYYQAA